MKLVVLGLSITSSWGNGHATTYRALLKGVAARGHDVTFLERRVPWYEGSRDLPQPSFCRALLYDDLPELCRRHARLVAEADAVIVGSYVPDGVAVGEWACRTAGGVRAFYDIDTPVTLAKLARGEQDYLAAGQIARYDLYLSFTGGPTLRRLEEAFGARRARALYCSVDPEAYRPLPVPRRYQLGYLGTYSVDRQPKVESLLLEPARRLPAQRFAVAGAQYPAHTIWPANVEHTAHLSPDRHAAFYAAQAFTLNVTRADMVAAGHSPSVRLFEAAACGVPIVSDVWAGLDRLFRPETEILLAEGTADVQRILEGVGEPRRRAIAEAARAVVLRRHTADARARELEAHLAEATGQHAHRARALNPWPEPRQLPAA